MPPMDFVLLTAGIAGLWLGTELTIGGALAIARRHHLSEFFVGLVILSIGSDLPELAIAFDAGLQEAKRGLERAKKRACVSIVNLATAARGLIDPQDDSKHHDAASEPPSAASVPRCHTRGSSDRPS